MKKLVLMAMLLATVTTTAATTTAAGSWTHAQVDGDDLRYVSSPDENMRLILRTKPSGKVEVYVDFRDQFGQGTLEINGLKTVWVFVWFDDKGFDQGDWPTGVEGRSMFVPDSVSFNSVAHYLEMIAKSKTMTVEVLRPVDDVKMRATFDLGN